MCTRRVRHTDRTSSVVLAVLVGGVAVAVGFVLGMAWPHRIAFSTPDDEAVDAP